MERKKLLMLGLLVAILSSCASTSTFPISDVLPAADISVKEKQDKHNNFEITIKAKHLADPERLNPPKSFYVVWGNTEQGVKNLGKLIPKNAQSAELKALTPFKITEIFITGENKGNISSPAGIEIARTSVK